MFTVQNRPVKQILPRQRIDRLFTKILLLITPLIFGACASVSQQLGGKSPIESLGAPTMVQTNLGHLAVWDTGPQGAGPVVVLWPSIFSDHVIYNEVVKQWRGKRRLVLIDGPGHGASDGPSDKTFSMQECAIAMKQVMDAKSINQAVVGGTSWGGLVGGEFALMYPQNTQGLVMLNTPFFVSPEGPSTAEKLITWGSGNVLGTRLFTSGVARSFFLPATRDAQGLVVNHFHTSLHRSDSSKLSNAIRSVLLERNPLADRLSNIKAPTLIIAGLKDEMYPINLQKEAASKLPKGQFEVVDSQHVSIVDKPVEVIRLLETFLNTLTK